MLVYMGRAKKSETPPTRVDLDPALLIGVCSQLITIRMLDSLVAKGCVGIRSSDGFVFQHLVAGPLPITELAKRLQMTQQGASKTVADLERRGYVERVQAPHDERVRLVTLTDLGWLAVDGARDVRDSFAKDLVRMLGSAGAERFNEALRQLTDELGGFEAIRARRLVQR